MSADEKVLALGKRLREVRKSRGLSQEKLGELAGIDRSYIGNIERGETNVTLKKVYEICEVLNIDLKEII